MEKGPETFLVVGDVHGHLQLALSMAARLQSERVAAGAPRYGTVFLCGDVGTFTEDSQLDEATREAARTNLCELEFLYQWCRRPMPAWLEWIFRADGLGLTCPVVMVHGNHEGFGYLETLAPKGRRREVEDAGELPEVARGIRYLPNGWRFRTAGGYLVGGIGGMEVGQRRVKYHPMAYIDEKAVQTLLYGPRVDILLTHQGPAALQGRVGSPTLDILLEKGRARAWAHGHGMTDSAIRSVAGCQVTPLGDAAFMTRGARAGDPGLEGYATIEVSEKTVSIMREVPAFWKEYRQRNWRKVAEGWVSPDLAPWIP